MTTYSPSLHARLSSSESVNSSEIAHLWAHQAQHSARCSAAMSFYGPQFYSYSTVIAEVVDSKHAGRVYLINEIHRSGTTSGHRNQVRAAIPHGALTFDVPGSDYNSGFADPKRILPAYARRVRYSLSDAADAKTEHSKQKRIAEAAATVDTMQAFAEAFGVKVRLPRLPGTPAELDKVLAAYRRADAAKAKREADAKAKRAAEDRRSFAAARRRWLAGAKRVDPYAFSFVFPIDLRIVGGEVETSRGVRFPIADAKRGLALVERTVARGKPWQANGHHCQLGHYRLDRIDADGTVHAGCHVVPYASIQRVAPQLRAS